ncbi:hypothetical protein [Actinophytocola xanthii]|uniref:Tetratricopeptide repeat protein n=1 Tax=Actinophytocola xanthii TaxID=1912961 RepID=A0A1Q8CWL3_9PSEU|nr:hypothetical protein [Actinophytocola xanthii]OLF18763.1 hypothetical protein BU204_04485 [Actinophytocola xanthii]
MDPDGDAAGLAALRRLAGQDPGEHLPRLAAALRTEAMGRAEAGDRAGALLAGVEAAAAYAGIVHPSVVHDVALAGLLEAMAHWFAEDGLDEAAAATAGDAVAVYFGLDEAEPGRHGPALARALSFHSSALWRVGEKEDALDAAMESVDVLCDTDASGHAVAKALRDHARLARELGRESDGETFRRGVLDRLIGDPDRREAVERAWRDA